MDEPARDLLRSLLRLSPTAARRVREATPARPHPRPQTGPTADYGGPVTGERTEQSG